MNQVAIRTDVAAAAVATDQAQKLDSSPKTALDKYHLVRLKEYEKRLEDQHRAQGEAEANWNEEQDEAVAAVERWSKSVQNLEQELDILAQSNLEREENFKALVLQCYPDEFDESKRLDIATLYKQEVLHQLTLNPEADLKTIQASSDNALTSTVLEERGKWNKESQELLARQLNDAINESNKAHKKLTEDGRESDTHLGALIRSEKDKKKKAAFQRQLSDAKLKLQNDIKENEEAYSRQKSLITKAGESESQAIQEAGRRLLNVTSNLDPFDDAVASQQFLQAKATFIEGIHDLNRLGQELAEVKQKEEEAKSRFDACQKRKPVGNEPDGNQLQFEIMMKQVNDHFNKRDRLQVLASVKTEVQQIITKLKQEKLQSDKKLKEDTKDMKKALTISIKSSTNEQAALGKRLKKMENELETVEIKLAAANAIRKVKFSADQKELVESIAATRREISRLEKVISEKKERLVTDVKALKSEQKEKLNQISLDLTFWESCKKELDNEPGTEEDGDAMETGIGDEDVRGQDMETEDLDERVRPEVTDAGMETEDLDDGVRPEVTDAGMETDDLDEGAREKAADAHMETDEPAVTFDDMDNEDFLDDGRREEIDQLNNSLSSLSVDEDDPLGEISHLADIAYNEPALQYITTLSKKPIQEILKLREQGNLRMSSLEKKNKLVIGDVHYYQCSQLESLFDVDDEQWTDIRHFPMPGSNHGLGKGHRRQWSYWVKGKKDERIQRIATHFPEAKLGIVRYHSKLESEELKDVLRPAPKKKSKPIPAPAPSFLDKEHLDALRENDDGADGAAKEVEVFHNQKAVPHAADKDLVLDTEILVEIAKETAGKWLNPRANSIIDPKAGELYLFKTGKSPHMELEMIKSDGYSWKDGKNVKQGNIYWRKTWYTRIDKKSITSAFTKHIYTAIDGEGIAVHYTGDEKFGVRLKGRYSTPHVLQRIREAASKLEGKKIRPVDQYKALLASTTAEGLAKAKTDPINSAAVRYALVKFQKETGVVLDDINNTMMTVRLSDTAYVRSFEAAPNYKVVLTKSAALDELNLVMKHVPPDQVTELSYDTTFDVQGKYLSILTMRHPYIGLKDGPTYRNRGAIIPLTSLLHETKGEYDHKLFLFKSREIIRAQCPEFLNRPKVVITDAEFAGMFGDWPNIEQALCWNHIRQNIHYHGLRGLPSGKMPEEDLQEVERDVFRFLAHKSLEKYEEDRDNTFATANHWNTKHGKEMRAYFMKNKDRTLKKYACRFVLDSIGLTNVTTGITSNAAETLNSQLTFLKGDNKPTSPDALILELEKFETTLNDEVRQAYYGVGRYELFPEYSHLLRDKQDLPPTYHMDPKETQQLMRKMMVARPLALVEDPPPDEINKRGASESRPPQTVQEHAKHYVEDDRVTLVIDKKGGRGNFWVVEGYGQRYTVRLTDNCCSCTFSGFCSHLLAVRVAAGLQSNYALPKGKSFSAVSKHKSLPTPGRRKKPLYGGKTPTKRVLVSDTTHPPEAVKTTVQFALHTPKVNRPTPTSVLEDLGLTSVTHTPATPGPPAKVPRTTATASNIRQQLFGKSLPFVTEEEADDDYEDVEEPDEVSEELAVPITAPSDPGLHPSLVAPAITEAPSRPNPRARAVVQDPANVPLVEVQAASLDILDNQLRPGEMYEVVIESVGTAIVYNVREGHLIVSLDSEKDRENWKLLETCTGLASMQALKNSRRSYWYELQVAIQCESGVSKETLARSSEHIKSPAYMTVPMTCSCGRAAFEGSPHVGKCSDCERTYHNDCPAAGGMSKCQACQGQFRGMIWSQTNNYVNTCPGDTLMTPVVDHLLFTDERLLEFMGAANRKMNPTDKAFRAACLKAGNVMYSLDNLGEAHDEFMSRVVQFSKNKRGNDCFMGMNEIVHNMRGINSFVKEVKCPGFDGNPCKYLRDPREYRAILLPANVSTATAMQEAVNAQVPIDQGGGNCGSCARRMPPGAFPPIVMEQPLSIQDKAHPPAILFFESPAGTGLKDAFAAPEEFTISGFVYEKKYIAINRSNVHYFCHFKRKDCWITYDGMAPNRYHVTTPIEKMQFAPEGHNFEVVEQIAYFRKNHPSEASGKSLTKGTLTKKAARVT